MELIKKFSKKQYDQALLSWRWLVPADAVPLLTSTFGDIFCAHKGMIFFLDLINGTFELVAQTMDGLEDRLNSQKGQEDLLMATLSTTLQKSGLKLVPNEIFDFKKTPKLGGSISVDNIQKMDFVTAVNVMGQIHQQIKDLPPGTEISDVNITK
jgi:hypothetical protein